jgi:tetratricopeptide (TPR) repeat protein
MAFEAEQISPCPPPFRGGGTTRPPLKKGGRGDFSGSRAASRGPLVWAVLLLLLALSARAAENTFPVTAAEQSAYDLLQKEGKPVKARELAETILKANRDSFVAYFVIGAVYARVEGSLPKAYYDLSKARDLIEGRWGDTIPPDGPWLWHARVLEELIEVTAEMDRYEQELTLLALHDRLYTPPLTASWGWPLMKLGRMSEARAKVAEALKSDKPSVITHALNTLGAIENEVDRPEASYEVYTRLVELVKKGRWDMHTVYLRNAGVAALTLLRFEEGERLLLESTKHFDYGTYSNPWRSLATLYILEGRIPEAVTAVREMQVWSFRNMPSLQQQSWADRHYVTAALLLECGYTEEAVGLLRRVLNRPDRRGGTSLHADQSEAGLLVFYWHALQVHRETLLEEASWSGLKDAAGLRLRALADRFGAWTSARRAASLIVGHGRLAASLRPLAPDSIDVMDWARMDLNVALGPGVVGEEIGRLLKRTDAVGKREAPYLKLSLGRSELMRGNAARAKRLLTEACEELPPAEVLQRAQAEALLGLACEETGDSAAAVPHYQLAMERAPGVFRALALTLPCTVGSAADAASREAAKRLARSPRLNAGGRGFTVRIAPSGALLQGSLLAPDGTVLCQVSAPLGRDPDTAAKLFCREFHRRAFAPKVDLAQTDITSLEGSNLTGDSVRDQVRDLFFPATQPQPK